MTDRIIEIADTAAFLSLDNGLLKAKVPKHPEITVPVSDIQCLILANPAITITGALLAALAETKALVLISDKNRMPCAMQIPIAGNYVQTEKFRAQIAAALPLKKRLWQTVVRQKIINQGKLLQKLKHSDFGLLKLAEQVLSGDSGNMEGRAAVIYWKSLFCGDFTRERSNPDNNVILNYGYAVLRAMTARACCAAGLHPSIGINHHNKYDAFCLADDLMEPFRPIVDNMVFAINPANAEVAELTKEMRSIIISALLAKVTTPNGKYALNALLEQTAEKVAKSFKEGKNLLDF